MKQSKLHYEAAAVEVTLLPAGDVIATSGLAHVDGDPGSWV